ncbi:DUF1850 domain-containing protein [Bacillus aquiflavi]|uniref:DUF1850 domain-containing protein n=1 Tax=Bacillus aquiflavi TaxID=2672567 RepID=A0A6B3VRY0_9BACI|nr:DUF1850 domain-containing protein [Bacillus aquiflavi]MBA4536401.1 DUF1850 domain-containing protein [Bacillus aquiflavi]NEY80769.1 DUF1850 domain-containing protein [Bacillus aquiflavi]
MLKRKLLFLIPLFILSISIFIFIPIKEALVFKYENTDEVIAYIPFSNEKSFQIKYTHSIHLSDVVESYKMTENNEMMQYELMFEDFAIGMPSEAGEGEKFIVSDGKYYLKNMRRTFPSIFLRTGKVRANHTIIYENKEYPLAQSIKPGTLVHIKGEKLTILQLLKGVNILEH